MKIHEVEQNSEEWFRLRAGIPTASEFSNIVNTDGKPSTRLSTYAATLAAEAFAGKPLERWEANQWARRGSELEAEARMAYELLRDTEITQVGFVTTDIPGPSGRRIDIGCSPDGLHGRDGLLEIKCLSPQKHVLALAYYEKQKRCPPDYVAQVQGQMLVCERAWVDLWLYHPDLPCLSIRVERDDKLQGALLTHLGTVTQERDALLGVLGRMSGGPESAARKASRAAQAAKPKPGGVVYIKEIAQAMGHALWWVTDSDGTIYEVKDESFMVHLNAAAAFSQPLRVDWKDTPSGTRVVVGVGAA